MECGESVIAFDDATTGETDMNQLNFANSALLSTLFYHRNSYDFATHRITGASTRGREFAQLLWKASTQVGFGIAGKYAVARYCVAGNTPDTVAAYAENVQ